MELKDRLEIGHAVYDYCTSNPSKFYADFVKEKWQWSQDWKPTPKRTRNTLHSWKKKYLDSIKPENVGKPPKRNHKVKKIAVVSQVASLVQHDIPYKDMKVGAINKLMTSEKRNGSGVLQVFEDESGLRGIKAKKRINGLGLNPSDGVLIKAAATGTRAFHYTNTFLTREEFEDQFPASADVSYVFGNSGERKVAVIDLNNCMFPPLCNDALCDEGNNMKCKIVSVTNRRTKTSTNYCIMWAVRDIEAGEPICMKYEWGYWKNQIETNSSNMSAELIKKVKTYYQQL